MGPTLYNAKRDGASIQAATHLVLQLVLKRLLERAEDENRMWKQFE